jgi:hypothetical protein
MTRTIAQRLTRSGVKALAKRPADRPYAETRAFDPDGNNFDISVAGFGSEEGAEQRRGPGHRLTCSDMTGEACGTPAPADAGASRLQVRL